VPLLETSPRTCAASSASRRFARDIERISPDGGSGRAGCLSGSAKFATGDVAAPIETEAQQPCFGGVMGRQRGDLERRKLRC